jgi:hypothetical protein
MTRWAQGRKKVQKCELVCCAERAFNLTFFDTLK